MRCVWQAPLLVCSCFALSCLLQLKPKQTAFPAGANREEVVGRGLCVGGSACPRGAEPLGDQSAQLGDSAGAPSPVTGSAVAKLSCCNVVCVKCSFHPVRKTWTCMKFIACTCWALFLFFKFISRFLDVKASGSCKEGILMAAETASSLEILLNPTQKCM